MRKPVVVAEIGCNHKGDIEIAKQMIDTAKTFCNVDVVKFQKRNIKEVLTSEEYNAPHPNPGNSYGATYGAHREFLEFSLDQHRTLKEYCEEKGIIYGCSVYDMTSAREILSLHTEFIKIPSATNTHLELLEYLCENHSGLIHISLGMTTLKEERTLVELFEKHGRLGDVVLYACTSGYPVSAEEVCLLEIPRLVQEYGQKVHAIGFSGHHKGIAIDVAAFTLGADYFERHFTLDRTWKGTDHAASLEPDGLRRMNRDLHTVQKALLCKPKELLDVEIPQRKKLKWDRTLNPVKEMGPAVTYPSAKEKFSRIKLVLMDVDGVLTDSGMYYTDKGDELKKFNTRDGQGIAMLKEAGIKTGILTREDTGIVTRRAKKIGMDFLFQGVKDKLAAVQKLTREQKLTAGEICYIGDDVHDLETLKFVGLSVVPRDAVGECKREADYVCVLKGGEGCVRELADLILQSIKAAGKKAE